MDLRTYSKWSALLLIFVIILAGCQGAAPTEEPTEIPAPTDLPTPTEVMEATESPAGAPVELAQNEMYDSFLVDEEGFALYLFTNDEPGVSNCYDQCADAWPPLLTEGEPTAGEGVDGSLLDATERTDGSMQVTYNGWPVYYFFEDAQPGDVNGQGVNDVWFLLTADGEMIMPEASGTMVDMTEDEMYGSFLVDDEGYALYLFTNDEPSVSNCYDQCADAWPPLLTEGEPTAAEGMDASLLGTTERTDGSMQVTYNGWPLYYFFEDAQPGDVNGQGVNDVWFLLDPAGEMIMVDMMDEEGGTEDDAVAGATTEVGIQDSSFAPRELTVKVGDTVVWTSSASFTHTVTADNGSFSSGTLSGGDTFEFTFTEAGTFPYYCDFHGGPGGTGMSGTIIVEP